MIINPLLKNIYHRVACIILNFFLHYCDQSHKSIKFYQRFYIVDFQTHIEQKKFSAQQLYNIHFFIEKNSKNAVSKDERFLKHIRSFSTSKNVS